MQALVRKEAKEEGLPLPLSIVDCGIMAHAESVTMFLWLSLGPAPAPGVFVLRYSGRAEFLT